jgi:hypothetical protein
MAEENIARTPLELATDVGHHGGLGDQAQASLTVSAQPSLVELLQATREALEAAGVRE